MFQYISCYSLSYLPLILVIIQNVSIHLMLLFIHDHTGRVHGRNPFQYISCYSLSGENLIWYDVPYWFQYISCYSLSGLGEIQRWLSYVSIHLMLLFISNEKNFYSMQDMFQYISCYSLSIQARRKNGVRFVSIHLMLLFISIQWQDSDNRSHVSIHLMLLFIKCGAEIEIAKTSFNTSHVTLYQRLYRCN